MSAVAEPMAPLSWFAQAADARLVGQDAPVARVTSDSRAVIEGDLFVALRGARHDGHDYVVGATGKGAVGAIVERRLTVPAAQLLVDDSLRALQDIAAAWRQRFEMPLIALTGSNGKTTTRQLLAAVLARRGPVLATRGNYNNHIGLPLTLLELRAAHRSAVIEMGANHAGEIARLTQLARPQIGVVTQAGDAHLEGFGSRDGVARAKGELFSGLEAGGIAVINVDDAYAGLWRGMAGCRQIGFGMGRDADVGAEGIRATESGMRFELRIPGGGAPVELPLPGRHNVMNALAAAACGVALGLDAAQIAAGLQLVQAPQGRVVWKRTTAGARLIDDTYNANPTSMQAGLELLAQQSGQRWAVLGAMAELGPASARLHAEVGARARALQIDRLCVFGAAAADYARGWGEGAEVFEDLGTLAAALAGELGLDVTVLVKGSRSARMEALVAAWCGAGAAETR